MPRLFLAVWPPVDVIEQIGALPRPDQPGVRWLPPPNWHVTLRFLGEADETEVAVRLDDAALPAARAIVGPFVARLGREVVMVPVDGLTALAGAVEEATADVGKPPPRRRFHGHVTIARLRGGAGCSLVGAPISGSFDVAEVLLVQSTLHPSGARYDVLRRWRLSERSTASPPAPVRRRRSRSASGRPPRSP